MKLTQKRLKALLSYNPLTGLFRWRVWRGGFAKRGTIAGSRHWRGYVCIYVNNRPYMAHRLAWLYTFGRMPRFEIDHRNRIRHDNRLRNLREATDAQNQENQAQPHKADSKSGLLGVDFHKHAWRARIQSRGRKYHLGHFRTAALAHAAYCCAKRTLHEFNTL